MTSNPTRPGVGEYAPEFDAYIKLVPAGDLLEFLTQQLSRAQALFKPLSDTQSLAKHPPYTWTLKQVLGHITDCERVFGYRALRLARNDATPLPGFDESQFMQFSDVNACPLSELLEEFTLVRRGHLLLLQHFLPDAWQYRGTVSDHTTTTRAIAYAIAGHAEHHLGIVARRLSAS
jgi:DinB superfamily